MATRLSLEFYGDVQLDRTLTGFSLGTQDISPALEQLGDVVAESNLRQFNTEGQYGSGGWQALSPTYGAWKARHYPGKTILRRSDALYDALTSRPFPVDIVRPQEAIFGIADDDPDLFYGGFHQRGEGVPRRRPVEFPESLRRRMVKIIQAYLVALGRI